MTSEWMAAAIMREWVCQSLPRSRERTQGEADMGKATRPEVLGVGCVHVGADYSAAQTEWLRALSTWKTRRGPRPGALDLLAILADLGYERPQGPATAAAVEDALARQRVRLGRAQKRRVLFLTACQVLAALEDLGYRKD